MITIPDSLTKTAVQVSLIALFITALSVFGNVLYSWLDQAQAFVYLTDFFVFFRRLLYVFDFVIHIPTLLTLLGLVFTLLIAFWSLKAVMFVIAFINER